MLKTYEFDTAQAIEHLEKANGKRVVKFYSWFPNGHDRLVLRFEGEKDDHVFMYFPNCINDYFFPKGGVVSTCVNLYNLSFKFVVREPEESKTSMT